MVGARLTLGALETLRIHDITGQAHTSLDARGCTQSLAHGKLKFSFFGISGFLFLRFFNAEVAKSVDVGPRYKGSPVPC